MSYQFNDTTNGTGLIQKCESYTPLGKATISGSTDLLKEFTGYLNDRYAEIVAIIRECQDGWDYDDINYTDFPILATNLVANQQDYSLPASENIESIKRIEVSYDGVNWKRAYPIDINEIETSTSADDIAANFSQSSPKYDIQYNSIFLHPIPDANVIAGLKLHVDREFSPFVYTDTTKTSSLIRIGDKMLSVGASMDWCIANELFDKATSLQNIWDRLEVKLRKSYGNKQKDTSPYMTAKVINYN